VIGKQQKKEVLYVVSHSTYMCKDGNSCGLTGAAAFFAGIPDAAMVLNSSLWCYFSARGYVEKQYPAAGRGFFCSQRNQDAAAGGTEEYLLQILQSIKQTSHPSIVLLENSCTDSTSNDDLLQIAKQANLDCPVICLDRHDLDGGFWAGYQSAAKAYFHAMPLQPRSIVKPNTVNLLGCSAGYYNELHDQQELRRMLTLAGYEVLTCPGAGSTTHQIATMTQAQLNIVVHDELGRGMAQQLEDQYGMPYVSLLPPYGINGSLHWLKAINNYMSGISHGLEKVQQEARALQQLLHTFCKENEKVWGKMGFDSIFIAAPSSVAIGISQSVRCEWIDTHHIVTAMHNGIPSNERYLEGVGTVLDGYKDHSKMEQQLAGLSGGLLLGSSKEKARLHQKAVENVISQHIASPVYDEIIYKNRPFMGLQGAGMMMGELWDKYIQRQDKTGAVNQAVAKNVPV
jgi:nitrogenase molybdenum-iron protein alpha/beta subunit